jgi:glycosyltransferase involved in cell wall biosynthesis
VAELGDAGCLFQPGDSHTLASKLREWQSNRASLEAAKTRSFQLAKERFSWEREKQRLLQVVGEILN